MKREIYFRAFEYEDVQFLTSLRNEAEFSDLNTGNKFFTSSEYTKKWIEDKIFNNRDKIYLMVCTIEKDEPIGYIGISEIDYINRKAQISGLALSKKFSNNGYGYQSIVLMVEHMFSEFNFNMLYAYIHIQQIKSLKIASNLGFQTVGLIRQFVYKNNKYHDVYMISILKSDYEKLKDNY